MADRRTLLASIGTVGTVAIAGCSNIDTESLAEDLDSNTSEEADTDEASDTDEESDADEEDSNRIGNGPEEAVRQFHVGVEEEDVEKMNEVLHSEEPNYPYEEGDFIDLELLNVEELSTEEVIDRDYPDLQSFSTRERAVNNITDRLMSEIGAKEVVWVEVRYSIEGRTYNLPTTAVRDNGDWKVYNSLSALNTNEEDSTEEDSNRTGNGPEEPVRQFFTAVSEGNVEEVNAVLHPESSGYPVEEEGLEGVPDVTVISVEELSSTELANTNYSGYSQFGETEEEIESSKENIKSETGTDQVAWVLTELAYDGEEVERPYATVMDDGDWKLYQ